MIDKHHNVFSFIKTQLSITDVVSEYATLKKAGSYYKGHCPFHHERTASFTVSPAKGIFYCFGCHIGGDLISFIAKIEHCSQLDAARHLAERYKIELPKAYRWEKETVEHKERYFALCNFFTNWCHQQLIKNNQAFNYLEKRGINQETIKRFRIGCFPGGSSSIKDLLEKAQKESFLATEFIEAKILAENKTLYSPFENRIIFPISDAIGRVCGFGGRIFMAGDERPKYYNSGENAFFTKGALLFGLHEGKKAIQQSGAVFLVEGYTDCLVMSQHGYINTLATLGTACTPEHLKLLSRYANKLYIVYDGDDAGQKAILRIIPLCWEVDLELFVITLPSQEDPASFLSKGNTLSNFIAQAPDIFSFFLQSLGKGFIQKSLQERIMLTRTFLEIIATLEDPLKQELLLQQAASRFNIPFKTLQEELNRQRTGLKTRSSESFKRKSDVTPKPTPERLLLPELEKKLFSAILNKKEIITKDQEEFLIHYLPAPLNTILKKAVLLQEQKTAILDLFDHLTEEEKEIVSNLLLESDDTISSPFSILMKQFQKKQWKIVVNNVTLKIEEAQKKGDKDKVAQILQEFETIKKRVFKETL